MAHRSDPRLLVLHSLRLKGFADPAVVAAASGLESSDATDVLQKLGADGSTVFRSGRRSGWSLTPAGRAEHARMIAGELEAAGCRATVQECYDVFLGINPELLAACTAWQLREIDRQQVPNDHTDPAYDGAVVGRLRRVDERIHPACTALGAAMERFGGYGPRLRTALSRVETGDAEWFTRPDLDSYHSVWFELHEDLLVTLGLERSREGEQLLSRTDP